MNYKRFATVVLIGCAGIFCIAMVIDNSQRRQQPDERLLVTLRNIGHELLHTSGDSTSRILPIKQITSETFELEFENQFRFESDTLIQVVNNNLKSHYASDGYLVSVIQCSTFENVYGFEISPGSTVLPCLGRAQAKDCYKIRITFFKSETDFSTAWLASAGLLVAIPLFVFIKKRKEKSGLQAQTTNTIDETSFSQQTILIGETIFDPQKGILTSHGLAISLSDKEVRLLKILSDKRNDVVTREYLLHEVWESEGVFTGRSLDVFISRLRKKIQSDKTISIVNVHGKGYRLQIGG